MGKLDSYKVALKGMPQDTVSYQWHVDDDFFSAVQGPEIRQGGLDVALRVKQTSGAYELTFNIKGMVRVVCDRCLELMDQPIEAEHMMRVRLGDEFADDGEVVTVPELDGVLNVAWYIYEMAALEIPMRHVHPDGECDSRMSEALAELNSQAGETAEETPTDPRWNELRKILNNNKK